MDESRTFVNPLEIPNRPIKTKAELEFLKIINTIKLNNIGKLRIGKSFLLVNLSTKKPDKKSVMIEATE